jgi:hypothetical protein
MKAIEAVVFVALRKPPCALAVFSCLGQGEFQREVFAKMRGQERIGAFLTLESGDALVERSKSN